MLNLAGSVVTVAKETGGCHRIMVKLSFLLGGGAWGNFK